MSERLYIDLRQRGCEKNGRFKFGMSHRLEGKITDPQTRGAVIDAAYRDFFEVAGIGVAEGDVTSGRLARVNPALCAMLGYEAAEIVGKLSLIDIISPSDRDLAGEELRRLMAGEIGANAIEKPFLRGDGGIIWGRMFATPAGEPNGSPGSFLAFIEEITAQKRTEARLRLALELGEVGAWDWDLSTRCITCTPAHCRLYGIHVAQDYVATFDEWLSKLHPDDRESAAGRVERAKATGHYADEFRVVWPDGTIRWLSARGRCEMDAAGRPAHILGVNVDITSQIASETLKAAPESYDRREYSDGAKIFWQGDPATSVFQVTSGMVKIYKILPDGRSQILGFEHAGSILGIPGQREYTYCAEALGRISVRRFSASEMKGLRSPLHSAVHRIAAGAFGGLLESQEHIALLSIPSARERLLSFIRLLEAHGGGSENNREWIQLPMSRQDIADYLALRRETVSRVLSALKQEGLIELEERRLRLLYPERTRAKS